MYNKAYFEKQKAGLDLHNAIVDLWDLFNKLQFDIPDYKVAFENYLSEKEDHFVLPENNKGNYTAREDGDRTGLGFHTAIRLKEEHQKKCEYGKSSFLCCSN